MPDPNFGLTAFTTVYPYEGDLMRKRKLPPLQSARVRALKKWLDAITADDAKPTAASRKTAKIKVFDPAISGMATAVALLKTRCADLMAPAT